MRAHEDGADCKEPEVDDADEEDGASASLGSLKSRLGVIWRDEVGNWKSSESSGAEGAS